MTKDGQGKAVDGYSEDPNSQPRRTDLFAGIKLSWTTRPGQICTHHQAWACWFRSLGLFKSFLSIRTRDKLLYPNIIQVLPFPRKSVSVVLWVVSVPRSIKTLCSILVSLTKCEWFLFDCDESDDSTTTWNFRLWSSLRAWPQESYVVTSGFQVLPKALERLGKITCKCSELELDCENCDPARHLSAGIDVCWKVVTVSISSLQRKHFDFAKQAFKVQ